MERDSNPRNPYEFAGFQNRCLKPLSHPSVRGIVANSADFSSRIGAEAVQLPPKSKSSPPGMIQPSPLRKGTSSLSRRTAQKSGSQFFSLAGESTRKIPGSRGDLQERPGKLIPRTPDYPRPVSFVDSADHTQCKQNDKKCGEPRADHQTHQRNTLGPITGLLICEQTGQIQNQAEDRKPAQPAADNRKKPADHAAGVGETGAAVLPGEIAVFRFARARFQQHDQRTRKTAKGSAADPKPGEGDLCQQACLQPAQAPNSNSDQRSHPARKAYILHWANRHLGQTLRTHVNRKGSARRKWNLSPTIAACQSRRLQPTSCGEFHIPFQRRGTPTLTRKRGCPLSRMEHLFGFSFSD